MNAPFSQRTNTGPRWPVIFLLLFTLIFYMVVYTFLHEAGHALVGLAFGQTLTDFNISFWNFSAHVGLVGELTSTQSALQNAAGAGFPLLVWAVFISLMPRKVNDLLHMLRLLASISVLSSGSVWIILPFFRLFGNPAAADDVTQFLRASQIHPLVLSGMAAVIIALGFALFLKRAGSLKDQFLSLRRISLSPFSKGARVTLLTMLAVLVVSLFVTLSLKQAASNNPVTQSAPPDGFHQVAEVDLASLTETETELVRFMLTEPGRIGVFIRAEKLDSPYLDLRLVGPGEEAIVLVHGQDWQANRMTDLRYVELPPGDYQLILSTSRSPGSLSVFIDIP